MILEDVKLFPFTLFADRSPGYCHHRYYNAFIGTNPPRAWFGFDVIVSAPTEVIFVVYDMHDMVHGGLGKEITRRCATVDAELTRIDCNARAKELAREFRAKELAEKEERIIYNYALTILVSNEIAQ